MRALINTLGWALLGLAFCALGLLAMALPAPAATQCLPFEQLVVQLSGRWHEAPLHRGLTAAGQIMIIFSTGDGDTWTAVVLAPDGTACLVASGKGWETLPPPPVGTEG
jgi:hypothetical protein